MGEHGVNERSVSFWKEFIGPYLEWLRNLTVSSFLFIYGAYLISKDPLSLSLINLKDVGVGLLILCLGLAGYLAGVDRFGDQIALRTRGKALKFLMLLVMTVGIAASMAQPLQMILGLLKSASAR